MWAGRLALIAAMVAATYNNPITPKHAEGEMHKIILDTDIGDDIDDAYALALLLSLPDVDLVGVVTAHGDTAARARLAAQILHRYRRESIPVYVGRSTAGGIGIQSHWRAAYTAGQVRTGSSVEFMHKQINHSPGEVVVVAIGPLTNVGDLLTRYPADAQKLKAVVIMGGSAYVGYNNHEPAEPEYNIKQDVAAARVLFTSSAHIVMAGLDATTLMKLDEPRRKQIFAAGTPGTDALAALTALWGGGTPTLFDPVAAAWACGHQFAKPVSLRVVIQDDGRTAVVPGEPNADVLVQPNWSGFMDWYVQAVVQGSGAANHNGATAK